MSPHAWTPSSPAPWTDAHTHLLPLRLARAIRRFFSDELGMQFRYPEDPFAARAVLEAAGVTRCWSLPYAHKPGMASALNQWMAEAFGDDTLVEPGATLHPEDDVEAVLREAVESLRLRIFKLHCSVGNFDADDTRLNPLWAHAEQSGMPVVVHVGKSKDGTTAGAELRPLARALENFPRARIILAHLGAPAVEQALRLLRAHPNLHADLTPVLTRAVPVPPGALAGVADRILFGSDTPNVKLTLEELRAHVDTLGLTDSELRGVLGGNAERLVPRKS